MRGEAEGDRCWLVRRRRCAAGGQSSTSDRQRAIQLGRHYRGRTRCPHGQDGRLLHGIFTYIHANHVQPAERCKATTGDISVVSLLLLSLSLRLHASGRHSKADPASTSLLHPQTPSGSSVEKHRISIAQHITCNLAFLSHSVRLLYCCPLPCNCLRAPVQHTQPVRAQRPIEGLSARRLELLFQPTSA